MNHHSQRPAVGIGILGLCLCVVIGCSPSSDSAAEFYDLPEVEPTVADSADSGALERYQSTHSTDRTFSAKPKDWPQLFGPDRTSVAPAQDLDLAWGSDGPPELWSIEIGTGYGSPVVSDGHVVFNHRVGDEEIIQCVRADDGETVWQHRYPTTFKCDVEYSDGPYSTPVVDGDRVYAVGGQGQLFCLQLRSGDVVWQRYLHQELELEDRLFPVGASPLISDNRLIFNLGAIDEDAGIVALDVHDGTEKWRSTDHPAGYCSPFAATIHGQPFLFVITNRGLVSLEPSTGKMDWMVTHYSRAPMSYNAVSPLVVDDKVFIVTGPGPGAVCVQVNADRTHTELWRNRRVLDSQFNTLIPSQGNVIGFTASGQGGAELRSVDLATGELQWKYHSLLRRGQGLMAGGALVLLGERGHLAAILPTEGEPQVLSFTSEPLMSEPCYCAPALAQSKLYLKDEQRLACFDLSAQN